MYDWQSHEGRYHRVKATPLDTEAFLRATAMGPKNFNFTRIQNSKFLSFNIELLMPSDVLKHTKKYTFCFWFLKPVTYYYDSCISGAQPPWQHSLKQNRSESDLRSCEAPFKSSFRRLSWFHIAWLVKHHLGLQVRPRSSVGRASHQYHGEVMV